MMDINEEFIKAVEDHELELAKTLLLQGADIHYRDDLALAYASEEGDLEMVRLLLENGANIHGHKNHALVMAAIGPSESHWSILELLVIEYDMDICEKLLQQLHWNLQIPAPGHCLKAIELINAREFRRKLANELHDRPQKDKANKL